MLNNKYLAVVLAVVAVIVVVYQLVFQKDEVVKKRKINTVNVKPIINRQSHVPMPGEDDSDDIGNNKQNESTGLLIDLYSTKLLQRVKPYVNNIRRELSNDLGSEILGVKKKNIIKKAVEKKEIKMPVLDLNGIVELVGERIKVAIINNRLYRKGDVIEGALITKIEKYKVLLKFNDENIILELDYGAYKGWIKNKNKVRL